MKKRITSSIFVLFVLLLACEGDPGFPGKSTDEWKGVLELPEVLHDYELDERTTPDFVRGAGKVFITNERATLGRVLFYDRNLSIDRSISCGSCHKQEYGFGDNLPFSYAANLKTTKRNTPQLINLMTKSSFFWDGRETFVSEAVLHPLHSKQGFAMPSFEALAERLGSLDYYSSLFDEAYGSPSITEQRIAKALAAFVASIPNMKSKRDKVHYGWLHMSLEELEGLSTFRKYGCTSCHRDFNHSGYGLFKANVGPFSNSSDPGSGGDFYIPSLRNVAISAPYMHDGSLKTLEEVLDYYRNPNIKFSSTDHNIKVILSSLERKKYYNMTDQEKQSIITYLKILTDEELLSDERFSDPFH